MCGHFGSRARDSSPAAEYGQRILWRCRPISRGFHSASTSRSRPHRSRPPSSLARLVSRSQFADVSSRSAAPWFWLSAQGGAGHAPTNRMVCALLSSEVSDRLEPLRITLGLDLAEFSEGVFSWRGFLCYKWSLERILAQSHHRPSRLEDLQAGQPCGKISRSRMLDNILHHGEQQSDRPGESRASKRVAREASGPSSRENGFT